MDHTPVVRASEETNQNKPGPIVSVVGHFSEVPQCPTWVRNAHQTGRPPTTLNFAPSCIILTACPSGAIVTSPNDPISLGPFLSRRWRRFRAVPVQRLHHPDPAVVGYRAGRGWCHSSSRSRRTAGNRLIQIKTVASTAEETGAWG